MPKTTKLAAGKAFPSLSFTTVDDSVLDITAMPGWRLVAVYRGKHCPLCKKYFKTLDAMLDDLKGAGVASSPSRRTQRRKRRRTSPARAGAFQSAMD